MCLLRPIDGGVPNDLQWTLFCLYLFNFWLVFVKKKKKIVEDLAIEYTNIADFPIDACVIVDRLGSHATNICIN